MDAYHCISVFLKYLKYYQLSYVILNFIMHILDENHQFYQKISPLPFSIIFYMYLNTDHCIWVFPNKSSIVSIILCNPQFYHTSVRWKYSVPFKNVSSSCFNNTLVVFLCLSICPGFCFPKYLQFYKLSYVILNFNIHMLDENLQLYQKISPLLFQLNSHYICMANIVFEVF